LGSVRSRRVRIDVASWQPPSPGWSGRLGPLPGVLRHEIRTDAGRAVVRVLLAEPLPFELVGAAALLALTPARRLPVPVSPDVAAFGRLPAWLAPWDNVAGLLGDPPADDIIRPYDLLAEEVSRTAVVLDATVTNPGGYLADHDIDAQAQLVGGQLTVRAGAASFTEPTLTETAAPLTPGRIAAVRALRSIRFDAVDIHDPAGTALRLVQLAMTGVVVHAPAELPGPAAAVMAAELRGILAEPLPPSDASATVWEARSVRQRRAALRHHAAAWAVPAAASFPDQVRTPSVSAILVVSEPETVSSALAMLAAQTYPSLELVLAVSTMDPVPTETRHPVQVVRVPTGHGVEAAFATAVDRARGSLITRFEPDAYYGGEHIWDLVLALHYSGATVVGKAAEFFTAGPQSVVRRHTVGSEIFTESLSDGPLLLTRSDLIAAGGWQRVAGGPGYQTHPFGFVRPAAQGPADSRSATDSRTFPLTVVTS
jgi:hypothetical protein